MACFKCLQLNLSIKLKLNFRDKMFQNKQNLSHQQALSHIQTFFPSVPLPSFTSGTSLKTILDSITTCLPQPQSFNHKNTIHSMKSIVDSQEYKIQRNMIEIDNYAQDNEIEGCSMDLYEQRSTQIDFGKKISNQTSENSVVSDESEDIWWNLEQKNNCQEQLEKECFSFLD